MGSLDGSVAFTGGGYGRQRGGSEAVGERMPMSTATVTATKSKNCR